MITRDFDKLFILRKDDLVKNADSIRVNVVCQIIQTEALKANIEFADIDRLDHRTLIIAVGGDGTMLEAMRIAHKYNATAAGINLGKVGFLTDFPYDRDLDHELEVLINFSNHYPVEERIALFYSLENKESQFALNSHLAFNEFVISNLYSDYLIKYKLFIGDRCAGVHRANALIVGTPTGSTAYTLSVGGGLLLPSMEAMQIVPVAPISMTSRPIIIPSNEQVRISIETEGEWILKGDGVNICTFDNNSFADTQIVITQSEKKVKILHSREWSYFDMLTQKLGWKSN